VALTRRARLWAGLLATVDYDTAQRVRDAAAALARSDLLFYVQNSIPGYLTGQCHVDICAKLQEFFTKCRLGQSPRLAIQLPPRAGKSFICAERFPAWALGNDPLFRFIVTSYGYDLAANFSTHSRDLYTSEYNKIVFPTSQLSASIAQSAEWETDKGGGVIAAGVGGPITGKGCHALVVDDPIKNWEEALSKRVRDSIWNWYTTTAYTRLTPGGGVLIIMTRWHPDDLLGRAVADDPSFEVISFPALDAQGESFHPERWPKEILQKTQKLLGPTKFGCLYQQQPSNVEGQIFKRANFKRHMENPSRVDKCIISVDAAFKETTTSDKVAIQVVAEKDKSYYVMAKDTRRMGYSDSVAAIERMYLAFKSFNPTLIIEDKANGSAIIEALRKKFSRVVPINPEGGKVARAFSTQPLFEAQRVSFLDAPWVEELENQLSDFPTVEHDDDVDALTQALNYMESKNTQAYTAFNASFI
jgi:predicted phage terminase large subunit-like protein